jgi:hypothetical protein
MAAQQMPLDVESNADRAIRLQKTPSRRSTLEALHLSLTWSDAEMRVLRAVVVVRSSRPMTVVQAKTLKRCSE